MTRIEVKSGTRCDPFELVSPVDLALFWRPDTHLIVFGVVLVVVGLASTRLSGTTWSDALAGLTGLAGAIMVGRFAYCLGLTDVNQALFTLIAFVSLFLFSYLVASTISASDRMAVTGLFVAVGFFIGVAVVGFVESVSTETALCVVALGAGFVYIIYTKWLESRVKKARFWYQSAWIAILSGSYMVLGLLSLVAAATTNHGTRVQSTSYQWVRDAFSVNSRMGYPVAVVVLAVQYCTFKRKSRHFKALNNTTSSKSPSQKAQSDKSQGLLGRLWARSSKMTPPSIYDDPRVIGMDEVLQHIQKSE